MKKVLRLYPQPAQSVPLQGLYLDRRRLAGTEAAQPCIYANFLTSLDGRIALRQAGQAHYCLPAALKSDEDFRLFLELYCHADCIITHGGYMRALQAGRLGNVLQLPESAGSQYLHDWRRRQGLAKNPDIVIISGSLDFPWHDCLQDSQQTVHIATGGCYKQECRRRWQQQGHRIHEFGAAAHVDAGLLAAFLSAQGYRSVYLVAGPDLLHALMAGNYVERFFVTISHQLLGGQDFKSLVCGPPLHDSGQMRLENMYMDVDRNRSLSQWYCEFSFKQALIESESAQ